MKARDLRPGETIKRKRGGIIEYHDELGRNTYYFNPNQMKAYSKEWVRLPNGEDRQTFVEGSNGYWRRHWYDIHTGELLRELDSHGEINLVNKRMADNAHDTQHSLEYRSKGKKTLGNSHELF
jgi:hypothetical protein